MKKHVSFTLRLMILGTALMTSQMISHSSAADLTIYPNFAEVREDVSFKNSRFEWMPPADLNQFLIPGSLDLEHPGVGSMRLLPPSESFLKSFEGKTLKVYSSVDEQFVDATVIRADLLLFEIDGEFIRIDSPIIKYPSLDGLRFSPTYSWDMTSATGKAELVYATRGLFWRNTRYTLNMPKSGAALLTAFADMTNTSSLDYTAPNVTFLAGDVNLQQDAEADQSVKFITAEAVAAPIAKPSPAPTRVSSLGEIGGLQSYSYPKAVSFPAKTTTGLPFIKAAPMVNDVLEYAQEFSAEARSVTALQRLFTFVTTQSLPGGTVTVREAGKLIGQNNIPNIAADGSVRLNLGKDFDTKLIRSVTVLEQTKKTVRFRVTYSIKNVKTRVINVRLSEYVQANAKLVNAKLPELSVRPDAFFSKLTLPAGETFKGSYELNFKLN
jgi:hypothetical protein